ncbi:MAG: hypothetical protein ACFB0B_14360 [Thermonemataceae bacterium]
MEETEKEAKGRPFGEVLLVGFILHAIVPVLITAALYNITGLGITATGFIMCIVVMALFVFMMRVWVVIYIIKWLLMLIPRVLGFIFRRGRKKRQQEEDLEAHFIKRYYLPTHLFCSLLVFFVTSRWLLGGTWQQVGVFAGFAIAYSLLIYWGQRQGYLDYMDME